MTLKVTLKVIKFIAKIVPSCCFFTYYFNVVLIITSMFLSTQAVLHLNILMYI